jgi:hypothetical protein
MLRIHGEVIKLGIKISERTLSCLIHLNILQSNKQLKKEIRIYPCDTVTKFFMRDRNSIYRKYFRKRVRGLEIKAGLKCAKVSLAKHYAERQIGPIR